VTAAAAPVQLAPESGLQLFELGEHRVRPLALARIQVHAPIKVHHPLVEPLRALKKGAQAIGAGTAIGAPTVDMLGVKRIAPSTAGAYAYPE